MPQSSGVVPIVEKLLEARLPYFKGVVRNQEANLDPELARLNAMWTSELRSRVIFRPKIALLRQFPRQQYPFFGWVHSYTEKEWARESADRNTQLLQLLLALAEEIVLVILVKKHMNKNVRQCKQLNLDGCLDTFVWRGLSFLRVRHDGEHYQAAAARIEID